MTDYRNQNLQGRSFRSQNLAGADFSSADLRGVDFRQADLTGAKFVGATSGVNWQQTMLKLPLSGLLGALAGLVCVVSVAFFLQFADQVQKSIGFELSAIFRITFMAGYVLSQVLFVLFALNRHKSSIFFFCQFAMIGVGAVAGACAGGGVILAGALMAAVASLAAVAAAVASTGAGAVAISVALVTAGLGAATVKAGSMGLAEIAGVASWLALGLHLNLRCLKHEESMLLALRRWSLVWRSWGGTDFRGASLKQADFSAADLRHARFNHDTQLVGCRWQSAKNLQLADTRHTLLEPRAVRDLLSQGTIPENKNFAHFNLRGAIVAGLDLHGVNFHHADLSQADLRECNLSECDFSEATVLGADFGAAEFSGAIVESWNIDKTTQFNGAHCRFVYLKRDRSESNPPQGEFADGDFAKLYQEIANTVDFIAHTSAELQALLRAIEEIKAQGGGIFLQQLERKADSVVLRVQSEADAEIDKALVYANVERQKAVEMLALRQEYEQKLSVTITKLEYSEQQRTTEKEHNDLLAKLLQSAIAKPNSVTFENNNMTQDHSRRMENVILNSSNANLGDQVSQSINIEQVADGELKNLLQQLSALIDHAPLSKQDRQELEVPLAQLTTQAAQATPQSKSEITKTVGVMKDLASIFKDLPSIGSQYGVLLAELSRLLM